MAIAISSVGTYANSYSGGAVTIPSFTPTANALLIITYHRRSDTSPNSITGHGTWVLIGTQSKLDNTRRVSTYACLTGASPSAGTVNAVFTGNTDTVAQCLEVTGSNVTSIANAIPQFDGNAQYNGAMADFAFLLSAFGAATNAVVMTGIGIAAGPQEVGYSSAIADVNATSSLITYYKLSEDTTPTIEDTPPSGNMYGIAFEIAGAVAAPSVPVITSITPTVVTGAPVTFTGTNLDSGTTTQTSGGVTVALTETSVAATAITSTSATIESTGLMYGVQTGTLTTAAGSDTDTWTATPASGNSYVTLTSVATVGQLISVAPLAIGDQIRHETVTSLGAAVVVNVDGTYTIAADAANGAHTFEFIVRDTSDNSWGTPADESVTIAVSVAPTGIYGRLPAEDGTAAPSHFSNSLPYTAAGKLAIDSTSTIDGYSNGLPYSAAGRICVSLSAAVTRHATGTPFDTNSKVAMANAGAARVAGGTPFTAAGQIAVIL